MSSLKLPVIDFSTNDLKEGMPEWDLVKDGVRKALETYGCFEAKFDKVPVELKQEMFVHMEELFDFPLEIKLRNTCKKPFRSYSGGYPTIPLFESMAIDDADVQQEVQAFASIFWPQGNTTFSKAVKSYTEIVSKLDQTVRQMILESYGLDKLVMEEHMDSTDYVLKFIKYKGPQASEAQVGLDAHTDTNIITILHQSQVGGLEVQHQNGTWIRLNPSPESFIVMSGDSFHALLNGRLTAANHRVMMTGNKARYSLALFSMPKEGQDIVTRAELVDEEHPLLYKPYDHSEFSIFRYSPAAFAGEYPLKAFCGV